MLRDIKQDIEINNLLNQFKNHHCMVFCVSQCPVRGQIHENIVG